MARPGGTAGPLESAESHVRGSARPDPTSDEPTKQRHNRAAAEERRLRQWTFEQENDPGAAKVAKIPRAYPLGRGAEHEVYFDSGRRRVVKITRKSEGATYGFGISLNNDGRGATAGEYLDRLILHNRIFNDDVRLEQVLPVMGGTKIVTSQPFIDGEPANSSQIDDYMTAKGFERLAEGTYYDAASQILVHDLHPRNAIITPEGNIRAVDPAILRGTPALAEDIKRMGAR